MYFKMRRFQAQILLYHMDFNVLAFSDPELLGKLFDFMLNLTGSFALGTSLIRLPIFELPLIHFSF